MGTTNKIGWLEIYYDGECGGCSRVIGWFMRQKHEVEIVALPYAGEEARERFPEIEEWDPGRLMVTRTDGGEVFRGGESWVMCLGVTRRYRWLARILGCRVVLPFVRGFVRVVSRNRGWLSRVFFGKRCGDGGCECGGGDG